jgi:ABC-type dipeptide/oligopeptide/nickel transport system ATPase component
VLCVEDPECLVQIRDLTVTYASGKNAAIHALDGVSFGIASAEVVGILGESGCGKSTLAQTLLQTLPANARCENGMIEFRGKNIFTLPQKELCAIRGREISLVAQDPALALNPVMTAGTQVGEPLRVHFSLSDRERRKRVLQSLSEVGFHNAEEIYSAYPHQLSGGQRQRIGIAQALVCRPALLIADEFTSKLDAALQLEIVELLRRLRHDHAMAILAISHDPTLFAGFADRIAIMRVGKIVEIAGTREIFVRPQHPYTKGLVQIARSAVIGGPMLRTPLPTLEDFGYVN